MSFRTTFTWPSSASRQSQWPCPSSCWFWEPPWSLSYLPRRYLSSGDDRPSSCSVTAAYPITFNKSNSPLWSQLGDQSVLITIFPLNICNFLGHCWAIEILLFTKGLITLKICLLLFYRLKSFQGTVIDLNLLYWHRVCGIQHIQRASTEKSLTLFESFYFTIVTFSTVGYGDISPDIWLGQLFMVLMICIAFAFIPRQVCVVYTWHMDLKFYTNMEKYSYNCLEICVGTFIWFHPR